MVLQLLKFMNVRFFVPDEYQKVEDMVDWKAASKHCSDTHFIINTVDIYPWDLEEMAMNRYINYDFIQELARKGYRMPTGQYGLSLNPAMVPIIDHHPDWGWFWHMGGVSCNQAVDSGFIERHLDKDWHWGTGGLSNNPNITPEFVLKYADKPWVFGKYGLGFDDPRPSDDS